MTRMMKMTSSQQTSANPRHPRKTQLQKTKTTSQTYRMWTTMETKGYSDLMTRMQEHSKPSLPQGTSHSVLTFLRKPRKLDDSELDSGDDVDRADRAHRAPSGEQDEAAAVREEEISMLPCTIPKIPLPDPSDGELYLLKVPKFLSIDPAPYNPSTFQVPKSDHHTKPASSHQQTPAIDFNPRKVARTTIRYRRRDAPSTSTTSLTPSDIASNARILRWSDGSLTLQIASDPKTQYPLPANALAPPQAYDPKKPVPTALKPNVPRPKHYNADAETYTYLAAPITTAQVLRVTHKITCGLSVQASKGASDDAVARLQARLKAAKSSAGTLNAAEVTEDPEMVKRKAELAEREREKAARRRENQEMRERERAERKAMGISGRGGAGGGGLTVGGLEDEESGRRGGAGRRAPARPGGARKKGKGRNNRGGEILSDEEEEYGRRIRTREDEYDEEDDFVAASDEEEDEVPDEADEEEEEEAEDEGDEDEEDRGRKAAAAARKSSPVKRKAPADAQRGTPVGAGNVAPPTSSPVARNKRRRVIEDEDED